MAKKATPAPSTPNDEAQGSMVRMNAPDGVVCVTVPDGDGSSILFEVASGEVSCPEHLVGVLQMNHFTLAPPPAPAKGASGDTVAVLVDDTPGDTAPGEGASSPEGS